MSIPLRIDGLLMIWTDCAAESAQMAQHSSRRRSDARDARNRHERLPTGAPSRVLVGS